MEVTKDNVVKPEKGSRTPKPLITEYLRAKRSYQRNSMHIKPQGESHKEEVNIVFWSRKVMTGFREKRLLPIHYALLLWKIVITLFPRLSD